MPFIDRITLVSIKVVNIMLAPKNVTKIAPKSIISTLMPRLSGIDCFLHAIIIGMAKKALANEIWFGVIFVGKSNLLIGY